MSRRNSGHSQDVYKKTNLLYSCEYVRDHQLSEDEGGSLLDAGGRGVHGGERKGRVESESGGWWCIYTLFWVSFKLLSKAAVSVRQSGRRTNANLNQVEGIGWRSCAAARIWICLHPINNPGSGFFGGSMFPSPVSGDVVRALVTGLGRRLKSPLGPSRTALTEISDGTTRYFLHGNWR